LGWLFGREPRHVVEVKDTVAMTGPQTAPRSRNDRYTRVAITLHWAIAAFIIFNLCTGFFMNGWPPAIKWAAAGLHVSSGMTVLALTVARVAWRLLNEPPPYPAEMKPWERHTGRLVHFLFYAVMVLMPLSGWAIVSAHPPPGSRGEAVAFAPPAAPPGIKPGAASPGPMPGPPPGAPQGIKVWNLIPLPSIAPIEDIGEEPGGVAPQHKLQEEFVSWHTVGGWLLVGLFLLHVAGALKHQIIDQQAEFARMGIGRKSRA
jgi:cytochrome b561